MKTREEFVESMRRYNVETKKTWIVLGSFLVVAVVMFVVVLTQVVHLDLLKISVVQLVFMALLWSRGDSRIRRISGLVCPACLKPLPYENSLDDILAENSCPNCGAPLYS